MAAVGARASSTGSTGQPAMLIGRTLYLAKVPRRDASSSRRLAKRREVGTATRQYCQLDQNPTTRLNLVTSYHVSSHCITSYRIASYRIVSHRIVSHRIASHCIVSHRIASHRIESSHIALHRIGSPRIALHHTHGHHIMRLALYTTRGATPI